MDAHDPAGTFSPGTESSTELHDYTAFSISVDEALDLLANARRRVIVATLADEAVDELARMELADAVASAETDGMLTSGARRNARVGLIQTHGPVLEEAGVVEIDDRNIWTLTARGAELATVLEAIEAVCGGDVA